MIGRRPGALPDLTPQEWHERVGDLAHSREVFGPRTTGAEDRDREALRRLGVEPTSWALAEVDRVLDRLGLDADRRRPARATSGGRRRS